MRQDEVAEALRRTELFAEVEEHLLQELAAAATVRRTETDEKLFEVGDPGDELYVIVEGRVRFSVTSKLGEEVLLSEFRAPQVFGELALVSGDSRSARAHACSSTLLVTVSRAQILEVLAKEPAAVEALLRAVGSMVRRLTAQFADREQKLTAQVEQLKVEIDRARREREVERLTGNDDFIDLRERAAAMRAARQARLAAAPVR